MAQDVYEAVVMWLRMPAITAVMVTTPHRIHPVYTPDDFAPLEFDEELTDVVFDEDDEPATPDEGGPDDDGRGDD